MSGLEQYVNTITEEYCMQLPPGDQSILREYFVPVSFIYKRKKETMYGLARSEEDVLEESVREKCAGMTEKRIRKIFKILDKGFKFIEPKTIQYMTGDKPSFVHGSNVHYTREFLLFKISKRPPSSLGEGTEIGYVSHTRYDPISASKVVTALDLNALEEIKIIELVPGKIHNNKVIYATVIDSGFVMTAYHTIVEDNFCQCAKLCIYNITPVLLHSLKEDTKIAIANPYYKKGDDGLYYIRQESPDEVIVMLDKPTVKCKNEKTESKSCADHKAEGNEFFKSEKYEEAINSYTKAIHLNKLDPIYWNNRAQCYIKLKQFEKAHSDAEQATQLDNKSAKCKYRLAMSWSGLGDHEESCKLMESIKDTTPELTTAYAKERLLLGNTRGEFDFEEMAKKAKKCEEIQIGEFVGPISIESSSKHGHAVIATRNIKKGDLVSVSKALGFVSQSKDKDLKETPFIETNPTGKMTTMRAKLLIQSLTKSVVESKLAAFRVFPLYNKRNHHEHIPIEYYTSKGYTYIRDKDVPPYQMHQLRDIATSSEFSYTPFYNESGYIRPSGVWPILSYFNHSCIGNFWQKCYRDILIIRACTDIPEGAELTTSYIDTYAFLTMEDRKFKLEHGWDWHCNCDLCEFESNPRLKNALQRAVLLHNRAKKMEQGSFKLLNQAFDIAEELKLGKYRFNSAVWNTIITLTTPWIILANKKDTRKYLGVMYRARTFLCELDLKHQWYYWMNCVGLANCLQLKDNFKLEAEAKFEEVESFIMDVA